MQSQKSFEQMHVGVLSPRAAARRRAVDVALRGGHALIEEAQRNVGAVEEDGIRGQFRECGAREEDEGVRVEVGARIDDLEVSVERENEAAIRRCETREETLPGDDCPLGGERVPSAPSSDRHHVDLAALHHRATWKSENRGTVEI